LLRTYDPVVEPMSEQLRMWGRRSDAQQLSWSWVHDELEKSGTYWVVARGSNHPHPRPVWGVWSGDTLYLSIGSIRISRDLQDDPTVTINLGSDTDVVIVEGATAGLTSDAHLVAQYNAKYDWDYTSDEYGPLTIVVPSTIIAWRSEGWAGREGIKQSGRWRFPGVSTAVPKQSL
jgi:hypothetical protein